MFFLKRLTLLTFALAMMTPAIFGANSFADGGGSSSGGGGGGDSRTFDFTSLGDDLATFISQPDHVEVRSTGFPLEPFVNAVKSSRVFPQVGLKSEESVFDLFLGRPFMPECRCDGDGGFLLIDREILTGLTAIEKADKVLRCYLKAARIPDEKINSIAKNFFAKYGKTLEDEISPVSKCHIQVALRIRAHDLPTLRDRLATVTINRDVPIQAGQVSDEWFSFVKAVWPNLMPAPEVQITGDPSIARHFVEKEHVHIHVFFQSDNTSRLSRIDINSPNASTSSRPGGREKHISNFGTESFFLEPSGCGDGIQTWFTAQTDVDVVCR